MSRPADAGGPRGDPPPVSAEGRPAIPLNPDHTPYHPKWYRDRIPITWWTRNRRYTAFIVRELTSIFVLYAGLLLLAQLVALDRGPESHLRFQAWLGRPEILVLHLLVLAGLLFHAVTWLNLAPRAIVPHVGGRRVPPRAVLAGHYLAWIVVSIAIAAVLLRTLST